MNMIENIARAITSALEEVNANAHSTFSDDEAEVCARTALRSMLDDRDGLVDAYLNCDLSEDTHPVRVFTAMIDAILAQPSTPTDVTPA